MQIIAIAVLKFLHTKMLIQSSLKYLLSGSLGSACVLGAVSFLVSNPRNSEAGTLVSDSLDKIGEIFLIIIQAVQQLDPI
jgi:RecA/RadA recombinase